MHKISQLKNGINLVTIPMLGTQAITVLALFPVGSRYETAPLSGASHFVEHMMFKGTKRRPNTQAISRELDAAGAEYNAFTSKDHTGYYIKIDSAQSSLAFDMLADMLFDSTFGEEEIAKEKGVIVEAELGGDYFDSDSAKKGHQILIKARHDFPELNKSEFSEQKLSILLF